MSIYTHITLHVVTSICLCWYYCTKVTTAHEQQLFTIIIRDLKQMLELSQLVIAHTGHQLTLWFC